MFRKAIQMKFLATLLIAGLCLAVNAQSSDLNGIVSRTDSVYSAELDAYLNLVIYEPEPMIADGQFTPILYIFGDILFETFAGSINYLHRELELIPNCILFGINEIPGKPFGSFQQEYASFISTGLMEQLSAKYNLNGKGVLFGHSRASRLVGRVIQENPDYINRFILSAPWFTSEHLSELEKSFSGRSERFSIYYSLSSEDLEMPDIREAKDNFADFLAKHQEVVQANYQFFENETHMSIPPLSFYFGIKYLLQ